MFTAAPDCLVLASLNGWEWAAVLAVLPVLLGAKYLPGISCGLGKGMSEFRKALDDEAQNAGKSAGGIFGKPAAEALTPDNQVGELYDPAVFRKSHKRGLLGEFFRKFWRKVLEWLRIKD